MGRTLIEACYHSPSSDLSAATERPESSLIGSDAGELAGIGHALGVPVSASLALADDFDVLIDFTHPEAYAWWRDQHAKLFDELVDDLGPADAFRGADPLEGEPLRPDAELLHLVPDLFHALVFLVRPSIGFSSGRQSE